MKEIGIDIETKSGAGLAKVGVYKYVEDPDWEIQLLSYSVNGGDVVQVDLANGGAIPRGILSALTDKGVRKYAYNSSFERVNLSRYIGLPSGTYINPEGWYDTMIMAAYNGLPQSLEDAGKALKINAEKMKEGKALIKLFAMPKDGRWTKPSDAREKWERYKAYNIRDVEAEEEIRKRLDKYMPPQKVWEEYWENERINDRGIRVDRELIKNAIGIDEKCFTALTDEMKKITGLSNPNSPLQLKEWLTLRGIKVDTLGKDTVKELIDGDAPPDIKRLLKLRLMAAKSSVKKYQAMEGAVCSDGRIRGMFRFYGAGRTGRFTSKIINFQNLPRNSMPDLDAARELVRKGDFEALKMLYDDIPDVLSQLIRTALIPSDGYLFAVADYSAVEARVLAYLAGEDWVLKAFSNGEDIYCATASRMFGVKVEKHGENGELRARGKRATLSCGYAGGVNALKKMGALSSGMKEEELQPLVDYWRKANPRIVRFWHDIQGAAMKAVKERVATRVRGIRVECTNGMLFMSLPSGRRLAYPAPSMGVNRFGSEAITFLSGKTWMRIETFGGALVENITQAVARDLLTNSLHLLSRYRVVGHVHDEVIVEVSKTSADRALGEIEALMATAPAWAKGLPLAADGYLCGSYRKQ
ncbi:MAG: hypothetical protein IJI65_09370 [Lachnospiraceae bacterium]|nr:hypothetical protein [Lachnospiraceae bacterium]